MRGAYNHAADLADHAYFKIPANWQLVNSQVLPVAEASELANSAAGPAGGSLAWSHACAAQWNASAGTLLTASSEPVVYASVQALGSQSPFPHPRSWLHRRPRLSSRAGCSLPNTAPHPPAEPLGIQCQSPARTRGAKPCQDPVPHIQNRLAADISPPRRRPGRLAQW